MTDEPTLVAGRYRLGARIGSGAMGVVWQAHDERLHRTVAVKQLLSQPGLSADQAEEARQRAMREGRIAARLAHPNAITVYDVAEHDGEPWLIMEYLPSKSLATVLNEHEFLAPAEAARIGAQIAAALVAAHAAGIVHRDVKPANVLLGEDGTVKITDFGISRATGDVTVTATGMLAGTPAYLAPEVAKGEQPTSAADVFSLGSTLYTAVEGHSPFGLSENTLALLYAVAAGKVQPPRQAGPLTALLMQLLRADPTERPTMTAAREALAAVAAGKPLPSIALANQRTDPYPKPQGTPPPGTPIPGGPLPNTPPPGFPQQGMPQQGMPLGGPPPSPPMGTRLDARPFAEPLPSGPIRQQQPPQQRPPQPRPAQARSGPPRTPPGRKPAAASGKKDARSIVLTVLAIIGAALVGILVASLLTSNNTPKASGKTTTAVQPTTTKAATTTKTTTAEPTTTTTTTTTTTDGKPTDAEFHQALRDYYARLPGDADGAWAMLTERAQRKSGGYEAFKKFWASLNEVELQQVGGKDNHLEGNVRFTKDGKSVTERYTWTMVEADGVIKIDNFDRRGRVEGDNG
ncbi:putative serine/threonine protein kinase [Alloactinosynnema sp. L-07]|uniref:serine/threonine-protein kinase n=1 Tax=Alloactinosynnema sp. L-07 TaxID=1653480 RepID=UPI00065F0213|nr:serine/threonine-protein kinase [Alloactinosynnema sp. L-07]CRK59923.1 putative serine/threonine protein kinase [Alloactinosynnema sp. L-07]